MPTAQNVLCLSSSATFDTVGDAPLKSRLETTLGHTLDLRDADGPSGTTVTSSSDVSSWAAGDDLIVMSSSTVLGMTDGGILASVATPVLHMEGWNLVEDDLAGVSSGETSSTYTQITILDSSHPVAGGLSGDVTLLSTAYKLNYCHVDFLPAGAVSIASVKGDSDLVVLYVIEEGDDLASGTAAPARRVVFPFTYSAPTVATSDAWTLFDAAVDWAGNPDSALTPSGASLSSTTDSGLLSAVDDKVRPTLIVEWAPGVDWKDEPTSGQWADITSDLRTLSPISWSRGRTTDLRRVDPGRMELTLDNRNRQWEPGYATNVRLRAHVRLCASWYGRTYELFRGYAEKWLPEYPNQGADAVVKLTAIDGTGVAARTRADGGFLPDLLVDAASPAVYYPLTETTSGEDWKEILRDGPVISANSNFQYAAHTFASSGVSKAHGLKKVGATAVLNPANVNVETDGALSLGFWIREDLANPASGTIVIDCRLSDFSEYSFIVQIETDGGITYDHHSDGTGSTLTLAATSDILDGNGHHLVVTRSSDANTITAYLDGVELGTGTHTEATAPSTDTDCSFAAFYNFEGYVKGLFVVHEELTDVDVAELYNAELDVFGTDTTDGRIRKLLQYLNVPTELQALDAGASTMPLEDLHGEFVGDCLDDAMTAELGLFFFNGGGQATFHNRTRRKATNPTLALGVGTSLEIHEFTPTNPDDTAANIVVVEVEGGTSASAIDSSQVDELGEFEETVGPLKIRSTTLAKSYADHLLAQRKSGSTLRVESVKLRPYSGNLDAYAPLLDLELSDRVSATVDVLSDSPTADLAMTGYVERLAGSVTGGTLWELDLRLSPSGLSEVSF